VEVHDALVSVEGGGGEFDLLRREPALREVGAEGQAAVAVVAADGFVGEVVGQLFGSVSIGAGGVPRPLFSTGDRVEAVVDDCVPAVALRATYPSMILVLLLPLPLPLIGDR